VHTDAENLTHAAVLSVLLYRDERAIWHQGSDRAGDIEVATIIELDRETIPAATVPHLYAAACSQCHLCV
jgi:hypothetical protein